MLCKHESKSHSVMSDSLGTQGLYSPWNFPGQDTEVGSLSLLQGSSQLRDQTQVSHIAGRFFTNWAIRESHIVWCLILLSSWHSWELWCTRVRDIELVVYFAWISLWLTLSVSLKFVHISSFQWSLPWLAYLKL